MKPGILLFIALVVGSCHFSQTNQSENMNSNHQHSNLLINETSPYLLQHAYNPVNWYPWGDEAFAKAKKEDKLVLISIGYAACHWCHVMEYESFEDEEVAKLMNEHFVCIKVDREERPDVDHTYMDAVQLISGSGGWPLNCFTLPDGRPIYGGTYFRKEHWMSVLKQLNEVYLNDKKKVISSAEELMSGLQKVNLIAINPSENDFSQTALKRAVDSWKPYFDTSEGGNKGAPKFPMPNNYLFLLKYLYFSNDELIKKQIELSLDKMAVGGIYDALGGGFARYSTDGIWKVPHFEKMLYDNAQLVSVYSLAYKLFKKESYKKVVYESLAFIEGELTSTDGTFFSAIDADSEGEEGTFYIWTKAEIDAALQENAQVFNTYYGISEEGNWEHGNNVLHQHQSVEMIAKEFGLSEESVQQNLVTSRQKLFKIRNTREHPITDDKILTSWNALTISAYVNAYRTFGEEAFLGKAIHAANYFKNNSVSVDGEVLRMVRKKSNIPGFLDDYSLLAQAFIDLYQATFDEEWLHLSHRVAAYSIQHFYDKTSGMFFFSSLEESETISNKLETSDNVIPASNSVLAKVLVQLGIYFDKEDYIEKAEQMLNNMLPQLDRNTAFHANWADLLCHFVYQPPEVVFTGKEASSLRIEFDTSFTYAIVAGSKRAIQLPLLKDRVLDNQSLIYVCRNRVCKLPVQTVEEALEQFK